LDPFATPEPLDLKRWSGSLTYGFAGRRWRFGEVERRLGLLLDDIDAQQVDHVLCTGDLTALAFDEELARAARAFGPRLAEPARYTVLPGNHDRYTREAVRRRTFERAFGGVSSTTWPWVRALADYPLHVRCAGSATDLKRAAGYDVYTIDARGVAAERRVWDRAAARYVRGPDVPRVAVTRPLGA
jgi:hypothetical protein